MTEDRLILSGLELWLKVGCTDEERAFPQRVEMDITLELPLKEAGLGDNLSASIDYAAVCAMLKEALEPRIFRLVEAVAERTAELVMWKYKVTSVTVRVKKRALPGLAWAGVEIRRG